MMTMAKRAVIFVTALVLLIQPLTALASVEYFRDDFTPSRPEDKYFFEGVLGDKLFRYSQGGVYVIDTSGAFDYGHSVLLHDLSTFALEARANLAGSTTPKLIDGVPVKAGWGVSFNYTEDENGQERFLLALLNPAEHNFTLRRVTGSTFVNLLGPFVCEAVHSSDNVLRVQVDAGRVNAYVNGELVGTVFESQLLAGGFGLYVTPRTVGEFDYLVVYTEAVPKSVVEDDFSGTPARWFTGEQNGVDYTYTDGAYAIDATGGEKAGMSLFPGEHASFELEVSVRKLAGPDNYAFGVFFQDTPNESGGYDQFRFLVSNDGWFTVQRSFEDTPRALYQWAESERLLSDNSNKLRARLLNGRLGFYINDYLVYDLADLPVVPGKVGLYVAAGVQASFDDFYFADF